MPDRGLIDRLEATGLDRDEATAQATRVFAAMLAQLQDGRTVGVDGIGRLMAPRKAIWVPGTHKRQAREERKIALRHPAIIEKGEPYAV